MIPFGGCGSNLQKETTNFRKPISPEERLAITIREEREFFTYATWVQKEKYFGKGTLLNGIII